MTKKIWIAGLGAVLMILSTEAVQAARRARIDVEAAEMLRGPQKGSDVLTHLKKGQRVTASNYPTEGYYKVRTVDGMIGWVKADILDLGPMPDLSKNQRSEER